MEKLRNKKAGVIVKFLSLELVDDDEIEFTYELPSGHEEARSYDSLAEFNEDWEDYKPVEPIIEDQKSRKVFQEWVKLYGAERFRATHFFNSKGHMTLLRSTDLTTEPSIELPGHIGADSEIYTRVELCGEEEG